MNTIITIKNAISEITGLLKKITGFGKKHNLSEEILSDIKLVVEEIVSNIIFYGFDDDAIHEIMITLEFSNRLITIRVEDQGKPFNPLTYNGKEAGSPLEDYEQGGMGILLIKELMDELEYEFRKGQNTLFMKKRI